MPKLTIDNREVEVKEGATILEAAEKLGIKIPTMCYLTGFKSSTSCMVCVVKVQGLESFVPSCASIAVDGMVVESETEEIHLARNAALELLLSDHLGDCMGPCHVTCPASMNIPLMIRQIAAGDLTGAIETVKKDIALPAVLGRICPAPCEKSCRRSDYDQAVSICLLKRYAADVDLESNTPYMPQCKPPQSKKVAIVGAGPAGLAAAYYLAQDGFDCTIFDDHEKPGGVLQYGVPEDELPRDVLNAEIALIEKLGVKFEFNTRIGDKITLNDLSNDYDAVFFAAGKLKEDDVALMGLKAKRDAVAINNQTYETNIKGVFAGGDAVRNRKMAVRSVADGKEAAISIGQYLTASEVTGPDKPFNIRIGKLSAEEFNTAIIGHSKESRIESNQKYSGFTEQQAKDEAQRCLHCDCRKPDNCKLRKYSHDYQARTGRYKSQRRQLTLFAEHPDIIFEPGKCIDCGLCVQITRKAAEKYGLTFTGRGFDVRIKTPFDKSLIEAIVDSTVAKQCIAACPTGALSSS